MTVFKQYLDIYKFLPQYQNIYIQVEMIEIIMNKYFYFHCEIRSENELLNLIILSMRKYIIIKNHIITGLCHLFIDQL